MGEGNHTRNNDTTSGSNPTNDTRMTDQQAATNDLPTQPGRGARQEPGAHSEDHVQRNVQRDSDAGMDEDRVPDDTERKQ